ncbi:MAG: 4Fe-4S dicluster domain-containing protein [Candidatus Aquicultorales bacterium]
MSVLTDKTKCNGCAGLEEPQCVKVCPGDLMALGSDGKSRIRSGSDCWDCMACVKACPRGALETRLPYQLALYKGSLKPKVMSDRIEWTLVSIDGTTERFIIKTIEV